MREKGTGNKKHNRKAQNKQGEVQNSIGNGEDKELICMTHGQELRGEGMLEGRESMEWKGLKGRKKWDNCNSIINNICLKKEKKGGE